MTRRLWINFAVFSVVFALLSVWAVRNVLHLDAIERPRTITAEFETSPGLRPGYEVTYFGVHAGQIGTVKLDGDHVVTQLKIERDLQLPAILRASVRRKSAVGEPYVDLTPDGGVDPGGPRVQAGANIPQERTTTPLAYSEVFTALDRLVSAVPPDDVARLLHAMAAGLGGRGDDIRTILVSTDQLTSSLAANAPLLDAIASDLTRLTHTLSEHRDSIGASWDNLAALTETLAAQKDALASILDHGPTLTDRVSALLASSGPDIGCIFDAAGALWTSINDPVKLGQFGEVLDLAGPAADIIRQIAYQGPDGLYLNGVFTFNAGGSAVTIYDPPHELPPPPAAPVCTAPTSSGGVGSVGAGGASAIEPPTPGHAVDVPERAAPPSAARPSSNKRFGASRALLPWLLLLAVLLAAVFVLWRRRQARGVEVTAVDQLNEDVSA